MKIVKNSFSLIDTLLLASVTIFAVLTIRAYYNDLVPNNTTGRNLIILSFGTSFAIFSFQYKSLRKSAIFISWLIISVLMIILFFWLSSDQNLIYPKPMSLAPDHYANGLKVPLILLLEFWVFRKISRKVYKTELLLKQGTFYEFDYDEKRNYNNADYWWMSISTLTIYFGHIF